LSLVGLNLSTEDSFIPASQVASSFDRVFLGGGASADEPREGLLDDRLGLWVRGNYSFGEKRDSQADHGFDADQWGFMGGADFRFTPLSVAGLAIGYGKSEVEFNPIGAGRLDTQATTAALYATMYTKKGFYADAIATLLRSDYDSLRQLEFTEGGSLVDLAARGRTNGSSVGFAFTLGYDFNWRAFTVAPSVGYNYLTSTIDTFRESGAAGLDLRYEEQTNVSGTANAGMRMSYAWKTAVGVVIPQIRGEYIREFIEDRDTFGVRFANDPFDDTPLIIVRTDVPDRSYWRLAGGLSAQFAHGISGFVEYQKLDSLRYFDYADVALGLRFEPSFE
jgi:outer membrane autotransporter protein